MKNLEKYEKAFLYFKESYQYKMGGTQTIILPNGKSKFYDDRDYYQGRGAKFNSSIKHDDLGEIKISRKKYSKYINKLKETEKRVIKMEKEKHLKNVRILEAKNKGMYSIRDGYVELSEIECVNQDFDPERLAKTLDININDVSLLSSNGKTYVFSIQKSTGKTIRLYHPSLDCNDLSISVDFNADKRFKELNHEDWLNAPFSDLVGQTNNKNHFVC